MISKSLDSATADKVLLALGLALSVFGLVLVALGYENSLLVAILGLALSLFSYFGMRLSQLSLHLDRTASIAVITDEEDNFEKSCRLVSRVDQGGRVFATSTFLGGDADVTERYRRLLNSALARNVRYQKVICFGNPPAQDRLAAWKDEINDKVSFMEQNAIPRQTFEVLHYPSVIHVDVVISQSRANEPLEMVAGFTGKNRRGGFHATDKQLISDWLLYYMEEIVGIAKSHTEAVRAGAALCQCSTLLEPVYGSSWPHNQLTASAARPSARRR